MITKKLERSTPEEQGVPSSAIEKFVKQIDLVKYIHSFMILRHGNVISEAFWTPCSESDAHDLFSLSKSFTSSAIGIAQGEGLLSVDDFLVSFFPDRISDKVSERMKTVRLRHLLSMSSGHEKCVFCKGTAEDKDDYIGGFLESELKYEPGTHFCYNTGASYMLAAVIKQATGENLVDYLRKRLFDPLSFGDVKWDECPKGVNLGGTGLHLSTEEVASFAQLWLQHGIWNGKQLIPADYFAMATAKQIDNTNNDLNPQSDWCQGYGFQIWICRHGCFRGDGFAGQLAFMMPQQDMVIAVTAGCLDMQKEINAIFDAFINTLSFRPLDKDPDAAASLRNAIIGLSIPMASGDEEAEIPVGVFDIEPNQMEITSISIRILPDRCIIDIEKKSGKASIVAGFSTLKSISTPLIYNYQSHILAKAARKKSGEMIVTAFCPESPNYHTLVFSFSDTETISINHTTPVWFAHPEFRNQTLHGHRRIEHDN